MNQDRTKNYSAADDSVEAYYSKILLLIVLKMTRGSNERKITLDMQDIQHLAFDTGLTNLVVREVDGQIIAEAVNDQEFQRLNDGSGVVN